MNNNRRQQLKKWNKKVESLKYELEQILSDEEMYFDSMPENLQGSTNGMNSEEAIDQMNDAIVCLDDAVNAIEDII